MRTFASANRAARGGLALLGAAAFVLLALAPSAHAAPPAAAKPSDAAPTAAQPTKPGAKSTDPLLGMTKSKDPIFVTADRLDVYNKEGRAVYSGASGVVATQGPSKLVGTELIAYYERQHDGSDKDAGGAGQQQQQSMNGSSIKRIVVKGPVSMVQNDQVATGDNADFDRVKNILTMSGHVALTQGPNVTTGDKLVYDLNSGVANVYSAPGTPVKSLFVQGAGSNPKGGDAKAADPKTGGPKPAGKPAPRKPVAEAGPHPLH